MRDMSLKSLRGIMGNVNGEAILFNTFYNNIMSGEAAHREQVVEAAKIASIRVHVDTEHGYDTMIGDRMSAQRTETAHQHSQPY